MMTYCHWCHISQPDTTHKSTHWIKFYWWSEWFSNCLRILTHASMFSKKQVGIVVVGNGINQGHRDFTTCWYMKHIHRVSILLQIFYDPIWGQVECDNIYLILSLHVVSCVSHKMVTQKNKLLHIKFSRKCVAHIFCFELDNRNRCTLVF